MTDMITCQACNYTRKPNDDAPGWECPKCQKAYSKTSQTVLKADVSADYTSELFKFSSVDLLNCDKLLQYYETFDKSIKQVVSKEIEDPMVMKTKWVPIDRVNGLFRLQEVSPSRLEFKTTSAYKKICILFMLMGIGAAISAFTSSVSKGTFFSGKTTVAFIVSALFVAAGLLLLKRGATPIVFDIDKGSFWKGKNHDEVSGGKAVKDSANLNDIHALQIIPVYEAASSGSGPYYTY